MRTVQEVFSRVQQDFNDITEGTFQRAEYLDAVRDIVDDLSFATQVYLNTTTVTPNPSTAPVSPAPSTFVLPANLRISYIERMLRGTMPCYEFTRNAVQNNNTRYFPFLTNGLQLADNSYSHKRNPDDSITISFAYALEIDEAITIDYFGHSRVQPVMWTDNTIIPQVLHKVVELGMKKRFAERLFTQGKPVGPQLQYLDNQYLKAFGTAKDETRSLIDNRSFIQIHPHRFLSTMD